MSKLRKKLQQARHEYQHLRYEGDLAADVLDQLRPAKKSSHWVRNLSIAATLAMVATAAIVMFNRDAKNNDVAIVTPTKNDPTTNVAPTNTDKLPTNSNTNDANDTAIKEEEQVWSVVPSGLASASETSFSLVPSLTSFDSASEESTDTTVTDQ